MVYLPNFTTIKQIKTIMKKKNLLLKSTNSLLAILFMVMSAFMFTACDDTDDPNPQPAAENSIAEIISSSADHSELAGYLEQYPDLLSVISDTTANLTVFAPNNAAFATLETTLDTELGNVSPDVIAAVLAFHVHTGGAVLRAEITESTALSTAQGENITFNAEGNVATGGSVDNVPYDGDEILATNGVVHSVGNILIPPVQVFSVVAEHLGKVSQAILLGADFTTLAAAINKADEFATGAGQPTLKSILSDESASLTVFAPVNQVFEQGGITLDAFTGQQWYGLIANHVLTEKVLAADLTSGNVYTSAAGSPITVLPSGGLDSDGQAGAEASIAAPDAFTGVNGIVHAIAGILVFPPEGSAFEGTFSVSATGVRGDGAEFSWESSVTIELSEGTTYLISDVTFGGYLEMYTDGAENPGEITIESNGTITITDVPDVVYPEFDDTFNGSGTAATDGSTMEIAVSNSFGESFNATLTKAGSRISFDKKVKKNNPNKIRKN